jgi:hypothetical protein
MSEYGELPKKRKQLAVGASLYSKDFATVTHKMLSGFEHQE